MPQNGSTILVTGAASGMGQATAALFQRNGWSLLLCDLHEAGLMAARFDLSASGSVETLAGDITAPDFGERLSSALSGRKLGAVVHCAGVSPTMTDGRRILDVNLMGSIRLMDLLSEHVAEGASIVLFASTAGHMVGDVIDTLIEDAIIHRDMNRLDTFTADRSVAYGVSKRGVMLLTQREAGRLGPRNIRVTSISPGIIDTPMGRQEMEQQPLMQVIVNSTPLKRMADSSEVAQVAAFLCSDAASFISGTDILVDGGSMIHKFKIEVPQ